MKRPLTELLHAARRFESALASHVEGAARSVAGAPPRQPIEIVHAVVDSVAREVEPVGRGRQTFPYPRVRVSLVATSTKERARLQAVCDAVPSLKDRIADRLALAGCAGQAPEVELTFVETPASDWSQPEFDIEYASAATGARASLAIELTISRGSAASAHYRFAAAPVTLGRGNEVRDTRQRLIRVNHVAFADGDDAVNGSVSRQHARIERDATSGFRLFDDASAQGTSVIRHGRGIVVPQGMRGLRLRSGDEIVLGQARVQFRLAADE